MVATIFKYSYSKISKIKFLLLFFFVLANCVSLETKSWSAPSQNQSYAVLRRVIDGDTLSVDYKGKKTHVRLIGIDTPEREANDKAIRDAKRTKRDLKTIVSLGKKAEEYMHSLIHPGNSLKVELDVEAHDKYDRLLAYIYLPSGEMLNEKIISEGYATPMTVPPNVRYAKKFKAAYARAREQKLGLWAFDSKR